jgi:hypothetical protein
VPSLERGALGLAALSQAMIAVLAGRPSFTNASRPPRGISDSGVALQVARSIEEVDAIMGDAPSPDREVMRVKQYVNFGFIPCYALLYLVMAQALLRRTASRWWGRPLAVAAVIAALAAAVFDVMDTRAITRMVDLDLNHTTQVMIDSLRRQSLTKWVLASVAIGLLSGFFLASRRWSLRAIGVLDLTAAATGLWGLSDNALLVWAVAWMAAGLFLNAATLKFLTYESAA